MRIALCQIPVSSRPDVNAERVRAALAQAADGGADLAVFPEATQIRFGSDLRAAAEPLDGPFCTGLAGAAKETGVALVAGVFEPAPDGRVYNTAVAYDGAGELVASYRKLHLFDAFGQRESDLVAPGSAPVICTLAGMRTGLEICYDVRFGELSRALAAGGAALLVLPAAWAAGLFKEEHWVTLVRAGPSRTPCGSPPSARSPTRTSRSPGRRPGSDAACWSTRSAWSGPTSGRDRGGGRRGRRRPDRDGPGQPAEPGEPQRRRIRPAGRPCWIGKAQ